MTTTTTIRRRTVKRFTEEQCPVCGARESSLRLQVENRYEEAPDLTEQLISRSCTCQDCGSRWVTSKEEAR